MHMGAWDVLLSITAKAMLAAEVLRPGQLVSIVPGCLAISRKTSLVRSLIGAYGAEAAFTMVPLTFKLPEELDEWAAWIKAHPREVGGGGWAALCCFACISRVACSSRVMLQMPFHIIQSSTPQTTHAGPWLVDAEEQQAAGHGAAAGAHG